MHALNVFGDCVSLLSDSVIGYVSICLDIFGLDVFSVRLVIWMRIHCIWFVTDVGYLLLLISFSRLAPHLVRVNRCSCFRMIFLNMQLLYLVIFSRFIISALTVHIVHWFAMYSICGIFDLRPIWISLCVNYWFGFVRKALRISIYI